ncbi:hypothetical protein EV361DRAFT_181022 [Lentinula raphanica]|nr:hypothetical protein EV361DRAFT_181022 [Lentinula raphanica]
MATLSSSLLFRASIGSTFTTPAPDTKSMLLCNWERSKGCNERCKRCEGREEKVEEERRKAEPQSADALDLINLFIKTPIPSPAPRNVQRFTHLTIDMESKTSQTWCRTVYLVDDSLL